MDCNKVSRWWVVSLVWARERVTRCEVIRARSSGGSGARSVCETLSWQRLGRRGSSLARLARGWRPTPDSDKSRHCRDENRGQVRNSIAVVWGDTIERFVTQYLHLPLKTSSLRSWFPAIARDGCQYCKGICEELARWLESAYEKWNERSDLQQRSTWQSWV